MTQRVDLDREGLDLTARPPTAGEGACLVLRSNHSKVVAVLTPAESRTLGLWLLGRGPRPETLTEMMEAPDYGKE